jgi:hypothetical protein
VLLDSDEEWIGHSTDQGWEFFVRQIRWGGGDSVYLRGPAKTAKGERGAINRESRYFPFADLSDDIQHALLQSRAVAVGNLNEKEAQR